MGEPLSSFVPSGRAFRGSDRPAAVALRAPSNPSRMEASVNSARDSSLPAVELQADRDVSLKFLPLARMRGTWLLGQFSHCVQDERGGGGNGGFRAQYPDSHGAAGKTFFFQKGALTIGPAPLASDGRNK